MPDSDTITTILKQRLNRLNIVAANYLSHFSSALGESVINVDITDF